MTASTDVRAQWIARLSKLARPVLTAMSRGELRKTMPVEHSPAGDRNERAKYTHLEALGRLLAGAAPWLACGSNEPGRAELAKLALASIAAGVDPDSPDCLNFDDGRQPLVDAAFLAHAFLRGKSALWEPLDERTKSRVIDAMQRTRKIRPANNNWLLFSAMIEAFFAGVGQPWDQMRVDYAVRQHEQWYKGDGHYGDGAMFVADYYNSYVIQPMLLDVLAATASPSEAVTNRARRYAIVQERLIAPDGSFPPVGRSLAYRCGAFQHLAQMALQKQLPAELKPAQVRGALSAIIRKTLDAPSTFDANGFLQIGLHGHQPSLGETYISTGSLYLCATAFLPLGLPADDEFWTAPDEPWTQAKVWTGMTVPADHAAH